MSAPSTPLTSSASAEATFVAFHVGASPSATTTARSSPFDRAFFFAIELAASLAPTLTPTSSAPFASARSRPSWMATGSYSETVLLARDQLTLPSAVTEASCGFAAYLYATTTVI